MPACANDDDHRPASAQSMSSGISSTMAEGMAIAAGISMADRAVDAVMGAPTIQHETVVAPAPAPAASTMGESDACIVHLKAFKNCLNSYGNDMSNCEFYMDMLAECRRNWGSAMSS